MATTDTPPAVPEPTKPEPFQVEMNGQMANFNPGDPAHIKAANKMVLRQSDYTKKMQNLAQDKDRVRLEREQTLAGRPQSGLDAGYGGPPSPSLGSTVGGSPFAGSTNPRPEHPRAATPTAPGSTLSPYDVLGGQPNEDLDEMITRREALQVQANAADAMRRQQEEFLTKIAERDSLREQQQQVAQLPDKLPGFTQTAADEAYYLLPEAEKAQFSGMSAPVAYEVLYHRHIAPTLQPQQTPPDGGEPQNAPPFAETPRGSGVDLSNLPEIEHGAAATPHNIANIGAVMEANMVVPEKG